MLVEALRPTAVRKVNLSYSLEMYGEVDVNNARIGLWLTQRCAPPFKKALAAQVQRIW